MKQPEALRLADVLVTNFWAGQITVEERGKAAAELRRLHAANAELAEALEKAVRTCFDRYSHHEVTADPSHFVNVALAKHKGVQG